MKYSLEIMVTVGYQQMLLCEKLIPFDGSVSCYCYASEHLGKHSL